MTDFSSLAVPGVRGLSPYQPGKPIEELERELGIKDIIKLASNENPLGTPASAVSAIQNALPQLALYPDGSAFNLKTRLAEKLSVQAGQITIGNGSNELLDLVARVFLSSVDNAVVSRHAFIVYPIAVKALGAELRVADARNFGHDLDKMAALVDQDTRVVFIANPNNPTGNWLGIADIEAFLNKIPASVIVVLDEAYHEFVDKQDYASGLSILHKFPNLIVSRTFSKAYGLAGLRVGYCVSSLQIADLLNRLREPFNVNSLALAAAEAVLDDADYLARSIEINRAGMQQMEAGLRELNLRFISSAGNFIAIDFGCDAAPLYQAFLHEGIIVRPVGVYEMPTWLRVSIGLPEQNARFLASCKKVLSA
ncbi:MAG TPA: histidinol-phosphate transaminase [Pseudomonadales bacterium]|nr:histidinol-phosphate transaminase [Pseudomonadales bacterium]